MRSSLLTCVLIGILAVAVLTPLSATADHDDGNMLDAVNYYAVNYNGDYRVCDASVMTGPSDLATVLSVWNTNAQKTITVANCNGPATNIVDVPDNGSPCGTGNFLGCANNPTQESPQQRTVWMEEDADGILNTSWSAQYYNNPDLTGSPVLSRTDTAIDFSWGTGSPGSPVPADNFSVRWTASMNFVVGGVFDFTTITDDGVKVFVDGVSVISKWQDQAPTTWTGSRSLTSGSHTIVMEYYDRTGGATAKLSFRHRTLFASVLAQEVGHNLGFDHVDCANGNSVMGSPICSSSSVYPTTSTQVDKDNWDRAYYPDAPGLAGYPNPNPGTGCIQYNWNNANIHNEERFDTWHFDGGATFVRSDPQNANGVLACGQMPGTRSYTTYSISEAHWTWFGGSIGFSINVLGTLPLITSLTAFGPQTMVIYWNNSNPAGSEVHIEMSTAGSNGPWTEVATDTASPYTHGGRSPATHYWYRLRSHSHSGGGFSSYSNVADAYTPPNVPSTLTGSFNDGGNANRVASCWSTTSGATSYKLFFYKAGVSSGYTVTVNPNTSCYGAVLRAETLIPEVYHIAVSACVAGSVCSPYRDMSGSYWWWIPCSTGTGCSAGGSPDSNGHNH